MTSSSGYDPALFARLRRLEGRSFWFRARTDLVIGALERFFPRARDFAEIGCGTGCILEGLASRRPGLRLTGIDLFAQALAFAGERVPQARLVRADARRLPFQPRFDVVGAFDVLEHIREDEAALAEMARLVRPGGGILLTVPQHAGLWSRSDERAGHLRRYTRRGLRDKVRRAGFDVLAVTGFVSLLLPQLADLRLAGCHDFLGTMAQGVDGNAGAEV
jgi:SAM-dependent methyltransferase